MTNSIQHFRAPHIEALRACPPADVAAVTLRLWRELAPELTLIVGEGGFKPLYNRSVRLAGKSFPWLVHQLVQPVAADRFTELEARFEAASEAERLSASLLLFEIFLGMLASLIGDVLTARILQSAWPLDLSITNTKDFPR
jgi:hypothetical protein